MNEVLKDIFRHNAWANGVLLSYCQSLTSAQLATSDGAVYGNLVATMQHLIGGEAYYWSLFAGRFPDWSRPDEQVATLAELEEWAEDIGRLWTELLAGPLDADAILERRRANGGLLRTRAGVFLAQTIHHGNVHREQVSHVLTSLGLTPPDISAWAYARESGRTQTVDAP